MLPQAYQLPVAIALILSGALTCFAGLRLFRIILGIYGFIGGALVASSMMGPSHTLAMVAAAIVGGIAGAVILVLAYFVGVALIGAGLGALAAHLVWHQVVRSAPPAVAVIVLAAAGAIAAMWLQRYVIVVATAFGGAWTVIVGAAAAAGIRGGAGGRAWILYPITPDPPRLSVVIAWVALGLAGTALQIATTSKKRK
jgi:Domain of unknown function (DUF4203)